MGTQPHPGGGPPHCHPGLKSHTSSLWFKSTLLLFLRLLLSTKKKKKMACQTFFFFFFQEKQATENGILQIYKHGEKGRTHRGQRGPGENARSPVSGRVLGKRLVFHCPKPSPGNCLSQIGQRTGDPATGAAVPPKVTTLCTDRSI